MSESLAWIRHLRKRRGRKVFTQALRMYRFHRLPFEKIIANILEVTQKHGAGYTFPTVASVGIQKPELLRKIIDSGSEVAVHGYRHVKYSLISPQGQENDIRRALHAYAGLGIKVNGFRAPYNAYDENTPPILDRAGFLWDGGIGYSPANRERKEMFRVKINGRDSKFICIPLSFLSDDLMIDEYGYTPQQMVDALNGELDKTSRSGSIVMFDLHPIRIGQPEYVGVLDRIISYGRSLGGWFPTVSEAVKSGERSGWKGHRFCCLLTGDIDNFYFSDYLKRLG